MSDDAARDREEIKRLLILLLVKLGATSTEISLALSVTPSTVRTMIPSQQVSTAKISCSG